MYIPKIYWLVVWIFFSFPISWEFHHPNLRTHIFQRGICTTNQHNMFLSFCGASAAKVLSLDPTGTNRQSLPDPHHARLAFDGERTAVPAQLMFDTRDMGLIHEGVGTYIYIII